MTAALIAREIVATGARALPAFRGKSRIFRAPDRWLRSVSPQPIRADVDGITYELRTEDLIDYAIAYLGGYQRTLAEYVTRRLSELPGKVFWDVGANVGAISLPVGRSVAGATVYSFEPSPPVLARLRANLAANPGITAVRPIAIALSDRNGTADFFPSCQIGNSGVGGLGLSGNRTTKPVSVPTRTADNVIADGSCAAPSLVKIDVEGFEPEVFSGMEGLLSSDAPLEIVFESMQYRLTERGHSPRLCVDLLRSHGFQLFAFNAGSPRPLVDSDLSADCDLVARRGC